VSFLDFLDRRYYGASVTRWLIALAVLFGTYLLLTLLQRWMKHRVGKFAASTATTWDDLVSELISRTRWYFLLVLAIEAAARMVPVRGTAATLIRAALVIAGLWQGGVWGNGMIAFFAERYTRLKTSGDVAARATVYAVGYLARIALWTILVVTGLDFFNIRVTALLTGLGIGGIAVALAAQNVLGDLFAAMAIVLDRPFVVGDFIVFDDLKGQVEHIGLKTTRIRSLTGEEIVIANGDLLKARLRNFGRLRERRIAFTLDVTYDTPPDAVARIPAIVKEVITSQTQTRFDRCHFLTFADSSLRFETVFFVLNPDYNTYADIHHAVNLALLKRFAAERIAFAFPTRTVVMTPDGETTAARPRPSKPASRR
jgi:small-conductance mechanosensitive channel